MSGLLLECHARIRRFTATALRLGEAGDAPPPEIAEAAAAVHRYFTVALPLHVEDEELSLAPRLRAAGDRSLDDALAAMASEHEIIDVALGTLVPRWATLARDPGALASLAPFLREGSQELAHLMDLHLAGEERIVFPAVTRLLDGVALEAAVAEMQGRRKV